MIRINKERGYFTFDPKTMSWWNSKIITAPNVHGLFITSEANFTGDRLLFSVRAFSEVDGDVTTIKFQQHATIAQAKDFLKKLMDALAEQTGEREKLILNDLKKFRATTTTGVFEVVANNGDSFLLNVNNLNRAITG